MPFKSKSQLVACLYAQERSKNKRVSEATRASQKWNCMENLKETENFDTLPWKTGCKAEKRAASSSSRDVVHIGPRGGKYVIRNGRKVYLV
jgi:hypothetical protein